MNNSMIVSDFFNNASSALSACWYLKNFIPNLADLTAEDRNEIECNLQKITVCIMNYDLPF